MNGFAIYYYWFSVNTITNKNMIMDDVINKFFNDSINMLNRKVFFIWANENWTNNPAFGNIGAKIENIYDAASFKQNIDNLMCYFKHVNYLKIDNKPVFFLHHPWFLNISEINLFKQMLCNECILNNFEGVHFIINSMNNIYENQSHYNFHFNYKKSPHLYLDENKQRYFDYEKYINDIDYTNNTSNIQTLVFDFDNRARLCNPDRLSMSTICKNNTEYNMNRFIKDTLNSYKMKNKSTKIDNILLVNAWNEWGEKMAVEPSNERGFYYLNLIKDNVFLHNSWKTYDFDISTVDDFGFIMTRCVRNEKENKYWIECYNNIRQFYPISKVIIIDDNSINDFIHNDEVVLTKCLLINSDETFKGCGEQLPYYYYNKYKFFKKAVIVHDSIFIQQYIDFNLENEPIKFLWEFSNTYIHDPDRERELMKHLNYYNELVDLYNKTTTWMGCFGLMSVIQHDFLKNIVDKYNLFNLLNYITIRYDRCCFERIFAVVCNMEYKPTHLIGNVDNMYNFLKYDYDQYIIDKNTDLLKKYKIIKTWTGR